VFAAFDHWDRSRNLVGKKEGTGKGKKDNQTAQAAEQGKGRRGLGGIN
jgi:hypothetical protein